MTGTKGCFIDLLIEGTPKATTVSDVDSNYYHTVTIGTQVWMSENLKTSKYRNGDNILTGLSETEWRTTTSGAFEIYENNIVNNNVYGKLYNWYAVNDNRGLCPTGWRVATQEDWDILVSTAGGWEIAGANLKEKGIEHWYTDPGSTNATGFTALGGGYRADDGLYYYLKSEGFWWTSSIVIPSNPYAWWRDIWAIGNWIGSSYWSFNFGLSVRCLKE